jgi:hypothetical protein
VRAGEAGGIGRELLYRAPPFNESRCERMATKSKAKKSAKAAKPAAAKKAAAKPAARARGPEISSDLRKVALAHALRRLK